MHLFLFLLLCPFFNLGEVISLEHFSFKFICPQESMLGGGGGGGGGIESLYSTLKSGNFVTEHNFVATVGNFL
jgi:hypothetical protein